MRRQFLAALSLAVLGLAAPALAARAEEEKDYIRVEIRGTLTLDPPIGDHKVPTILIDEQRIELDVSGRKELTAKRLEQLNGRRVDVRGTLRIETVGNKGSSTRVKVVVDSLVEAGTR